MIRPVALAMALLAAMQSPSATGAFRQGHVDYVGIRYWLQQEDGRQITEGQAQPDKRYFIHLRSNLGGFLQVFSTADGGELTPRTDPQYAGLQLRAGRTYEVPGTFRLTPPESSDRLVFLFARSQTEMVRTADQALAKLTRLESQLITETIAEGPELGTYVVNRHGNQPSATIRLTR